MACVSHKLGKVDGKVEMKMPGGVLKVEIDSDGMSDFVVLWKASQTWRRISKDFGWHKCRVCDRRGGL